MSARIVGDAAVTGGSEVTGNRPEIHFSEVDVRSFDQLLTMIMPLLTSTIREQDEAQRKKQ